MATTHPADAAAITAPRRPLLRVALALDAVVTAVNGAAYLVAAGPLGDLLGLSPQLLRGLGALLLAFAPVVALPARRERPPPGLGVAIILANVTWAARSLVVVGADVGTPTTAGTAWVVIQALVVGVFAELQLVGRRQRRG